VQRPAWADPRATRTATDGFDDVIDAAAWVQHVAGAALETPPPAGTDAALFCGAVLARVDQLPLGELALHTALNLHNTAAAKAIEQAIARHNLDGLRLPDHLREYVATRQRTRIDYTQPRRGGDPWRHAARNRALARAAYEWRDAQGIYSWRTHHPDLAAPAACLDWTVNALTETLDCIAEHFSGWPTNPPPDHEFFPSGGLCNAHGLRVGDDQDELLHRIYPEHFRGLLIGHAAALCIAEWERRIADDPALP
jgi:hypothetical protein